MVSLFDGRMTQTQIRKESSRKIQMGLKGVVEEIWLLIIPNLPPTPSGAKKSLKLLIVPVNEKKTHTKKTLETKLA